MIRGPPMPEDLAIVQAEINDVGQTLRLPDAAGNYACFGSGEDAASLIPRVRHHLALFEELGNVAWRDGCNDILSALDEVAKQDTAGQAVSHRESPSSKPWVVEVLRRAELQALGLTSDGPRHAEYLQWKGDFVQLTGNTDVPLTRSQYMSHAAQVLAQHAHDEHDRGALFDQFDLDKSGRLNRHEYALLRDRVSAASNQDPSQHYHTVTYPFWIKRGIALQSHVYRPSKLTDGVELMGNRCGNSEASNNLSTHSPSFPIVFFFWLRECYTPPMHVCCRLGRRGLRRFPQLFTSLSIPMALSPWLYPHGVNCRSGPTQTSLSSDGPSSGETREAIGAVVGAGNVQYLKWTDGTHSSQLYNGTRTSPGDMYFELVSRTISDVSHGRRLHKSAHTHMYHHQRWVFTVITFPRHTAQLSPRALRAHPCAPHLNPHVE